MTRDHGGRWWDHAACAGLAPLFDHPTFGDDQRTAARGRTRRQLAAEAERLHRAALICARCPVRQPCAADAQPGRDEGIRAGKVLDPIDHGRRAQAARNRRKQAS